MLLTQCEVPATGLRASCIAVQNAFTPHTAVTVLAIIAEMLPESVLVSARSVAFAHSFFKTFARVTYSFCEDRLSLMKEKERFQAPILVHTITVAI